MQKYSVVVTGQSLFSFTKRTMVPEACPSQFLDFEFTAYFAFFLQHSATPGSSMSVKSAARADGLKRFPLTPKRNRRKHASSGEL